MARDGEIRSLALVNPYDRDLQQVVTPQMIAAVRDRRSSIAVPSSDRIAALSPMPENRDTYVYAARVFEPELARQLQRGAAVLEDYQTLSERTRSLQIGFNAALLALSLLIVAIAIWIALRMANRLVRPVGELVNAARQVTAGDLSVRVPAAPVKDEISTLGIAFNQMTSRLEEQRSDLVTANAQLDSRRAFTEAVLSA